MEAIMAREGVMLLKVKMMKLVRNVRNKNKNHMKMS